MAYPTRAYRTTPRSPPSAPDRTRRRESGTRRTVPGRPGPPSELGKPLPKGGGSKPYDFPKGPRGPGPGGRGGPSGFFLSRNPWIAGFKFGWMLGDKLYDMYEAGVFSDMYMHFGGWSVCCIGTGSAQNASRNNSPCGTCTQFSAFLPPSFQMPSAVTNAWATMDVVIGAGTAGSNLWKYIKVYQRPAGVVQRPAFGYVPQWFPDYYWVPPMARPVAKPGVEVRPRPYDAGPDPLPEGHEEGEPSLPPWLPGNAPIAFGPPSRWVTFRVGHRRRPPPRRTRERKLRMRGGLALTVKIFNGVTEALDFVDALFDAIPDGPCKSRFKKPKGPRPQTPQSKIAAIYTCGKQIDFETALFNIIWQQITDNVWAKLGLSTKDMGRIYGSNMGVNMLLNEVLGDTVGDALEGVEDWLRDQIAKKLGVQLI